MRRGRQDYRTEARRRKAFVLLSVLTAFSMLVSNPAVAMAVEDTPGITHELVDEISEDDPVNHGSGAGEEDASDSGTGSGLDGGLISDDLSEGTEHAGTDQGQEINDGAGTGSDAGFGEHDASVGVEEEVELVLVLVSETVWRGVHVRPDAVPVP